MPLLGGKEQVHIDPSPRAEGQTGSKGHISTPLTHHRFHRLEPVPQCEMCCCYLQRRTADSDYVTVLLTQGLGVTAAFLASQGREALFRFRVCWAGRL